MKPTGERSAVITEWRSYWTLPLAAAFGMATCTLHIYSLGPFMAPLHEAFGWSRALVSAGITIAVGAGSLFNPLMGAVVDRFGPRPVALIGVTLITGAMALLGTATGDVANWVLLWLLVAFGALCVQPMTWTSAVASRFHASRGLALAITLCGGAISSTIFPLIGTFFVERWGWRIGFLGLGGAWAAMLLPVLFIFFRGANDRRGADAKAEKAAQAAAAAALPGLTFKEGVRTAAFYKLAFAGACYSFALVGLIVHMVPLIRSQGIGPMEAAGLAGITGVASVAGRLITGALLDRIRGDWVGMFAFLLPVIAAILLLFNPWGVPGLALGVALVGFSIGSELDVIAYLCSRHFGMRNYGALFGGVMAPMALGTALGPLAAGAVYDYAGNYVPFLTLMIPTMLISAVVIKLLGPYPVFPDPKAAEPVPSA